MDGMKLKLQACIKYNTRAALGFCPETDQQNIMLACILYCSPYRRVEAAAVSFYWTCTCTIAMYK